MAKISTITEFSIKIFRDLGAARIISRGDAARLKHLLIQGLGAPGTRSRSRDQGDRKGENLPAADQEMRAFSVRSGNKAAQPIFRMEKERICCLFAISMAKYS